MLDLLTLVVVDDSPTDRAIYRRFLSQDDRYSYRIVEFETGGDALAWCQQNTADVILLDYLLPDMDGLEFLAALKQRGGKTILPVAVLSAYGKTPTVVESIRLGAQDYLDKSQITVESLSQCVHHTLAQTQLKQDLFWQQEQQRLVTTTALRICQSLNIDEILETAANEIRSLLQTDRVLIYQFNSDWSGQIVVESVGAEWVAILGETIDDPCFKNRWIQPYLQGRVSHIEDIHRANLQDCHREMLSRYQVRANLVVPLLQGGHLWGLLIAHHCANPRRWQEREISLLQQLAVQMAIALEKAELHQNLRRELSEREQSEIRFKRMFEQSPEGKARFAPNGSLIAVNRAWEKIWDTTAAMLEAYNILHDPGVASDGYLSAVRCAFAGETVKLPAFFHNPSQWGHPGRSRWVDMMMYPVKDSVGRLLEVVIVVRDITDRIMAQHEQQRLVRLVESSPNFIGTATLDGHVTFVNSAGQTLLGLEAERVTQTVIWEYQSAEAAQRLQSEILPVVLSTGQWSGELEMRHFQTGELIPVWCHLFAITNPQTGDIESMATVIQDLREKQEADRRLRESEGKLRFFIQYAPASIAMFDREMCYLFASQRWLDDFRIGSVEPISGRSHYDLFPDLPERIKQSYQRGLAGFVEKCDENLYVHADGTTQWFRWEVHPWNQPNGDVAGIFILSEDITERKLAEIALRESEERWQLAVAGNNDGIWDWKVQTGEVFFSARWKKMLGFEEHELENSLEEWSKRVHPDDIDWVMQNVQTHFEKKTPFYVTEHRVLCKDGSYKWILDRGKALWDEQGNVVRLVGSHTDTTERRMLENSLRQKTEQLQLLIKYAPVGIAMFDQDMRYIASSQRWLEDYDLETEEGLAGQSHYEIFPEIPERWRQVHQRCLAGAIEKCDEDLFIRADGTETWVRWEIRPWYTPQGTIGGIVLFTEDITLRKRTQLNDYFLNELDLRLRQLSDSKAMQWEVVSNLGQYLKLDHCVWCEVDEDQGIMTIERDWRQPDLPSHAGTYSLSDLISPELQALHAKGKPVVIDDVLTNPHTATYADTYRQLNIGALLAIPCNHCGRWIAALSGNTRTARNWRNDEVSLMQEVVARLWLLIEQAQSVERLRQSEEKFRQLADNINDVFWMSNTDSSEILYINHAYETVWGRSCESLYREPLTFIESVHPADRPWVLTNFQENMIQPFEIEYRVVRPDGSIRWVMDKSFPVENGAGEVYRRCGIVRDITRIKQAEELLREANEQLEERVAEQTAELQARERLLNTFFEAASTANIGLCILDDNFQYIKINESLATINGISVDHHAGLSASDVIPEVADVLVPLLHQVLETHEPIINLEVALALPDRPDYTRYWLASYFPIVQEGDRSDAVGCIVLEISDRKQAEEQLHYLNTQLQESNKELESFAFIASHDLKEPLRTVRNFSTLLQMTSGDSLDDRGKDYLNRIDNATLRMQALIDDLLRLSRIATAGVPFQPVNLNQVMEQVIANLQEQIQRTGGQVQVETLPTIQADPGQMVQLLQNLVSNALKFHGDSPPIVKLYINQDTDLHNVLNPGNTQNYQLCIEDNGIGFDPRYRDRIFGAFERLQSRSAYEGTGIGLAICKKIVERHGGTIAAHSIPGQGAIFTLNLPQSADTSAYQSS